MSTKKYVLRIDATITAGELAVMLQQLGALPTYVDVPDSQVVPEGLKRFFVPVNTTDDQLSLLRAHHEETAKRIQDLEVKLAEFLKPEQETQSQPVEVQPLSKAKVPSFEETLAEIRARAEKVATASAAG